MPENEIRNLQDVETMVDQLNAMVPTDYTKVEMKIYGGGPDESRIIATQRGYLRLGIEFMRAAFLPKNNANQPDSIDLDLGYLISDDSDVSFDWFERVDRFPMPPQRESAGSRISGIIIALLIIGFCVCAVIGLGTVIRWIVKGLT
jgi:hypothetical protein